MATISMSNIYSGGTIFQNNDDQLIYLTPSFPQRYTSNTWIYKKTPTQEQWLKDLERQHQLHTNQGSNHYAFSFPENEQLDNHWMTMFKDMNFELGIMELYAIESDALANLPRNSDVEIAIVDESHLDAYLKVAYQFSLPFGKDYADAHEEMVREHYQKDVIKRLVAYLNDEPIGVVDVIESENYIEIDGFGVLEQFRHQGIGSTIQSLIGEYAISKNHKPIILVADGEDTAKDMYAKQGYVYQSFCYQILKEDIGN
ncbi:TPA: GNAT family N-acetyltransferase [Staphylococcus aureus]|uniref:GNAT family N-acetyltransferase n=1 Tax=Staphylococcus aureus TaxID=1280 RepID=UPI0005C26E4C|nr:GNAT family N-acetyltransferase [Staphylococcus aureus]HDH6406691.1 GNAT family N-acetyltransferase [Staphylococcus aureus MRSA-Lux-40]AJP23423.1 acetyltransferase [Staphylococcus aureus]ATZ15075.1 N-acetyltransferase [Staphylococcus aureus]EJX2102820.1 GNAT family N-acetyltransferase [Staphylococcus aureus]EKF1404393.1 GNAT family N-acetyltransferase [Staphylococcus aureus]